MKENKIKRNIEVGVRNEGRHEKERRKGGRIEGRNS